MYDSAFYYILDSDCLHHNVNMQYIFLLTKVLLTSFIRHDSPTARLQQILSFNLRGCLHHRCNGKYIYLHLEPCAGLSVQSSVCTTEAVRARGASLVLLFYIHPLSYTLCAQWCHRDVLEPMQRDVTLTCVCLECGRKTEKPEETCIIE